LPVAARGSASDEKPSARQENWIDPLPQRLQQRLRDSGWRYYERGEPGEAFMPSSA